jgi:hypothetical protein
MNIVAGPHLSSGRWPSAMSGVFWGLGGLREASTHGGGGPIIPDFAEAEGRGEFEPPPMNILAGPHLSSGRCPSAMSGVFGAREVCAELRRTAEAVRSSLT